MSKSLGNGVDPLEVIDKYGADALRLTLITGNAPGNDMRYSDKKVACRELQEFRQQGLERLPLSSL
jgi:valyl-tRNA synthetase